MREETNEVDPAAPKFLNHIAVSQGAGLGIDSAIEDVLHCVAEGLTSGLGPPVGGLRGDPAEAGDRSQFARTADRDKVMGAGRGDSHSRQEGNTGRVFRPVGSASCCNSARARVRPAQADRSCPADEPRDACGVARSTRRGNQARDC